MLTTSLFIDCVKTEKPTVLNITYQEIDRYDIIFRNNHKQAKGRYYNPDTHLVVPSTIINELGIREEIYRYTRKEEMDPKWGGLDEIGHYEISTPLAQYDLLGRDGTSIFLDALAKRLNKPWQQVEQKSRASYDYNALRV